MNISRRLALGAGVGALASAQTARAGAPGGDSLDATITQVMQAFEIPGLAVALVRPDQAPIARGYGVRRLGRPERIDADTLFGIASNSKAFTTACLALLVDEGRLGWDEPVVRHLPEFAMSDPVATRLMTVRDLLVHRSGLALGAGDLMQIPASDRTRENILHGLRHLPLTQGFRNGYAYDNILYIVAGIVIERVSGQAFEDFLTERLLRPMGMTGSTATLERVRTANMADRHERLGPPVRGLGPVQRLAAAEAPASSPAGGIQTSANDIVFWLQIQLRRGALADGRRLWSESAADQMWTPQVITDATAGPTADDPTRPVLTAYALGWFVFDYRGRRYITHSGVNPGQTSRTGLFPDQGLAFAVFTNSVEGPAVTACANAIADHLLGEPRFDWLAWAKARQARDQAQALKGAGGDLDRAPPGGPTLPLGAYAGRYQDPWYGDIVITQADGRLRIDFTLSPGLQSVLEPWGADAFRTRFAPGAGEDAIVTAVVERGGVQRLKLRALSPLADFSYDFHDLAPVRIG